MLFSGYDAFTDVMKPLDEVCAPVLQLHLRGSEWLAELGRYFVTSPAGAHTAGAADLFETRCLRKMALPVALKGSQRG